MNAGLEDNEDEEELDEDSEEDSDVIGVLAVEEGGGCWACL